MLTEHPTVGTVLRFVNEHLRHAEQQAYPTALVMVTDPPWEHTTGHQMVWVVPTWARSATDGWYAALTELEPVPEPRVPRRVSTVAVSPGDRLVIWRAHWYRDSGVAPHGG